MLCYAFDWQINGCCSLFYSKKVIDKKRSYCKIKKIQEKEGKPMKKWIALLLAASLCAALAACGGTGNPEHDYVLSLMEKGDYDMAISVLENLRDQANGTKTTTEAVSKEAAQTDAASDVAEAAEAPTGASSESIVTASPLTAEQQLVADAVNATIQSEDFAAWQSLYKEFMGNDPKTPEVTSALHYQIGSFDGEKVDCYLINISADVAYWVNKEADEGAVEEQFQILVDTNTKAVYNSITADIANYTGDISTSESRATYLLWVYNGIQTGNSTGPILNEMEITAELTTADIAAISAALAE